MKTYSLARRNFYPIGDNMNERIEARLQVNSLGFVFNFENSSCRAVQFPLSSKGPQSGTEW